MSSAQGHIAKRWAKRWRASRARPRRRTLALVSAMAVLLLVIAVAFPIPTLGGNSVAVAAIQRAKSLMELMHQRSPGKRTIAQLAQTKHKKAALHQRALPKVRRLPAVAMAPMPAFPAELPPALVDLVAPPVPMQLASLEALPVGPFAEQPLWPFPPSAPGGFILPPPAETGTTTPPPVVVPPVVGPPAAAVPEPQSWALMLIGFGMIGWTLRRRSRPEQTAA